MFRVPFPNCGTPREGVIQMLQRFGRVYWDDVTGDVFEDDEDDRDDDGYFVDLAVDEEIERRHGMD